MQVPEQEPTKMDEYEIKFAEMQKYIPFLEAMIERLKKVKDNTRAPQLQKMQSLHGILSDSKRKLKLETLQRCEDVLQKLHSKVEKGNSTIPKLQNNKNADDVKSDSQKLLEPKKEETPTDDEAKEIDMKSRIKFIKKMEDDETPASPSPPASPDQAVEQSVVKPIIIPTERNDGFSTTNDRPASPDACEMIPFINAKPIIIPTERKEPNPLRKVDPDPPSQRIPTWTYPDGIVPGRGGQSAWQPDSRNTSPRSRVIRHIPTALPPSKGSGGVLRKPVLVLEKKISETEGETEPRLLSPEPESHARTVKGSPKSKDLPPIPKLASTLLTSPPPVLTMPPLTIEDLAELLQDADGKRSESRKEDARRSDEEEAKRAEKRPEGKAETSGKRDERPGKSGADAEIERRWDESDKLNGKSHQANRRIFTSPSKTSTKHADPRATACSSGSERPTDPRNRPPSPTRQSHKPGQDSGANSAFSRNPETDPKSNAEQASALYHRRPYAGNGSSYTELDPRRDKSVEFYKNILQRERDREREREQEKQREREREIQRERERELQRERERDLQREREIEREMLQGNRGMMHHSPGRGEPCNQNQWAQGMNYSQGQGPNIYPQQQQQRPDRWMPAGPNLPMETHMMPEPGHMRPSQYQGPPNSCGRPMLGPQEMGFREDMQNPNIGPQQHPNAMPTHMQPGYQMNTQMNPQMAPQMPQMAPPMPQMAPPMPQMAPQMPPQYHQFPPENRSNVQQFDRPQDFQHSRQSWEPTGRPGDGVQYQRPQGPQPASQAQWNRAPGRPTGNAGAPTVPPPLMTPPGNQSGNRNFNERPRGPDPSRNPPYNRDPRDTRDPRIRSAENSTSAQNTNAAPMATQRREHPRFSKEQPAAAPAKPREVPNDRNPGKKANEPPDRARLAAAKEKELEREKARKRDEKKRREQQKNEKKIDKDNDPKATGDKSQADVMQSPLESLYGVIDTTAKTGKGYGLQRFKIPKIRKPPPKVVENTAEENWDAPDEITEPEKSCETPEVSRPSQKEDDKKSEVTSTTGESSDDPQIIENPEFSKKDASGHPRAQKKSGKLPESEQTVDTSTKSNDSADSVAKEAEAPKLKEEVTQELIQALIRKSLESGEVKELFKNKLMQKFGEAFQGKKFKKILTIIDSDSDSSEREPSESKRVVTGSKKKRRAIVSDSSEEECLAERLGKADPREKSDEVERTTTGRKKKGEGRSVESDDVSREATKKATRKKKSEKKTKPGTSEKETIDEVETESEQQPGEKSEAQKPTKPKPRRRNSLEMLQEDIREMFISEGVVSATGHRMCRLVKEAQEHMASTAMENQARKNPMVVLEREEARNESNPEDGSSKGARPRVRKRRNARPKLRKSAQEIVSSDSETEDSVRTEMSGLNDAEKSLDESAKGKEDKCSRSLRRSERVVLREPTRVTRRSEKSLDRADSSKTIFDSSSDESFGIDVSELTAAVDISLHSESRPGVRKKKSGKAKRSGRVEKTEPVASADEVESIASDLSRASSLTRGKKGTLKQDTNEELMSDLLTGLADPKGKSFDDDADNENDPAPASDPKAAGRRRKKTKKGSWAMGVLKKKKRKPSSLAVTSSPELASSLNIPGHLESTIEVHEAKVEVNTSPRTKKEVLSPVKSSSELVVSKTEPVSPVKSISSVTTADTSSIEDKKSLEELLLKSEGEASTKPLNVDEFVDYVWSTKKDKFNCLFCNWNGKNIVHHYTLTHGDKETLISRFSTEDSEAAIAEARSGVYDEKDGKVASRETREFQCRFCGFRTSGPAATALEAFYEHCTTHTGEYRFRCKGCSYQTVVKSSMRTHCYRRRKNPCRASNSSLPQGMSEDPIPQDDRLWGYICTKCNFVQLKESNLTRHVKMYHEDSSEAQILKIDMSCLVEDRTPPEDAETELKRELDSSTETETVLGDPEVPSTTIVAEASDNIDLVDEIPEGEGLKKEESLELREPDKEKENASQGSQEVPTGNLNAFVCPPELENKEDEIQLERRKKMQEIVEDIGLANNLTEKRRDLSIIDKLKDKIMSESASGPDDAETPDNVAGKDAASEAPTSIPVVFPESIASSENPEKPEESAKDPIKTESEEIAERSFEIPRNESEEAADKSEKKLKDPLADLDEVGKDTDDDENESDAETIPEQPPAYESDTSTEQSDTEIPADVNSLLEETFSIGSTVNVPMMTTIQRLAAKLQGKESFPGSSGDDSIPEKTDLTEEEQTSEETIPKKPNAIPISSIQKFLDRRQAVYQEVAKEITDVVEDDSTRVDSPLSTVKTPPRSPAKSPEKKKSPDPPSSPPKKFIRLRRLSGDMLSVPSPVEAPAEIKPVESSSMPSTEENPPEPSAEVAKNDDEECSFLRIENVVSLAPGADGGDAIVAGATTVAKPFATLSLLKKGLPTVKRPIAPASPNLATSALTVRPVTASKSQVTNYIPIRPGPAPPPPPTPINITIRQVQVPTVLRPPPVSVAVRPPPPPIRPAPASSPAGVKQNFKIVKVVRGLTLLKKNDSAHRCVGSRFKNPDIFATMLEPVKLRHLYKCMSRNCAYTTDCLTSFGLHYRQHKENIDRNNSVLTTYDFQRCAYCLETLSSWNAMSEHLKDKHTYCQYQCGYCFYRALAQSYVELHQHAVHPMQPISVLFGQKGSAPMEVINRREFVAPFVCQHECGKAFFVPGAFLAHLRIKHSNSLSIYKCHLCPAPSFKAEHLVSHYKLHGMYKFQCLYCLFGSEEANDVHSHLSASHYNRRPHVLERALQPRPVRDRDILQQLVLLNVDESYRCNEVSLIPGQDPTELPKNKNWRWFEEEQISKDETTSQGDVTLPLGNIGMSRLFSYEMTDGENSGPSTPSSPASGNATPVITKIRKVSSKKSPENILIVDDNGAIRKIAKRKDNPEAPIGSPTSETPANAPRSLLVKKTNPGAPGQGTDEFVSVNLFDSPDIVGAPISADVKDDDDSDIEIIEDISSPSKNSKPATETEEGERDQEETKKEEAVESTENSGTLVICSSNENSMDASTEPSQQSETKPRTLDDIKDSGFTGPQLYRCGYDGCDFGAESSILLRHHVKDCFYASELKNLNCVHCNKRFLKIGFLLEHFKLHGLKRFGCSMCSERWPMSSQAMSHMKLKHKQTYTKLIPVDPKNLSGLFVVEPIPTNGTSRTKKRGNRVKSGEKDDEKSPGPDKLSFGPNEIEVLPRQAIYQREVHCAVCPYTTKVRTNIIRHLQLHAKDETVPESGPVNPVPCLDKKERMFDKMVNLASSSHQNGRMGGRPKEPTDNSDAELLPKFVPERQRYVCGVTNCNYLTCDEPMLRYHLKALHPDETFYRCPHCPAPAPGHETQNVAIDKMAIHFKMHDSRLYKCSHCNNHHYHRHVVERHLTDKHPEVSAHVRVIREPDATEVQQPGSQEDGDEGTADPEGNHWKCNLCEYRCVYKTEMSAHAGSEHNEKGQFKCNLCSYKTNNKISFDQHVNAKHPYDASADCTLTYQKIKGVGLKKSTESSNDPGASGEPFDTTPLWRRDMPRVRHIRGILFEDENPSKSEGKSSKRKSDTELLGRPAKSKPGKSTTSDASLDDSLWGNILLSDNSVPDSIAEFSENSQQADNAGSPDTKIEMAALLRKYGPLGSPDGCFYCCTVCQTFRTKYKHDMRHHLFRDLKYWRYRCTLCGYSGVNKTASLQHFQRVHERSRRPTEEEQEALPVNPAIETWVEALLNSQKDQMHGLTSSFDGINKPTKTYENSRKNSTEGSSKANMNVTQSPIKDSNKKPNTVDLTRAITDAKRKSVAKDEENSESDGIIVEDDDDSSNDALIIDNRDGFEEEFPDEAPGETTGPKTSIVCKHCNAELSTIRTFKSHVELRHLRRNAFLCLYCDTSLATEKQMSRHLKILHRNLPHKIVRNPVKSPPDLTPEFWEKEYNLQSREKSKKRKLNEDDLPIDPLEKSSDAFHICHKCGFRALNYFGLKVHMRRHDVTKDYKCAYCPYFAYSQEDLWKHSELNHASLDWKVGNGDISIAEKSEPGKSEVKESIGQDSESFAMPKSDLVYSCLYCDSGKTTLEGVEEHWKLAHKKTGLPFRYNEVSLLTIKNALRCGYCPKRGSAAQIRLHSRKKHSTKPVKFVEVPQAPSWMCSWCDEVCETEHEKKVHHNLYHSHLAAKFKRREGAESESRSQETHECPECPFKTASRPAMEKHLEKHVDSVICRRCDKTFRDVSEGIRHNTQVHPRDVSKIEGFKTNVEKLMSRVRWANGGGQSKNAFETVGRSALDSSWKNSGVARKSTTKSSLLGVRPSPSDFRSVARKSTNPLPRYPPGLRFVTSDDDEDLGRERYVSYYKKPIVPVNLTNINTYITFGGRRMKLTCSALAQLIDIEPSVMVEDVKRDAKRH